MDVLQALGAQVPSHASIDTPMTDLELLQLLQPVFSWDEGEAAANSHVLFPARPEPKPSPFSGVTSLAAVVPGAGPPAAAPVPQRPDVEALLATLRQLSEPLSQQQEPPQLGQEAQAEQPGPPQVQEWQQQQLPQSDPVNAEEQEKPRRRGRPPKVPGQFSRGYDAIKRKRQQQKTMVQQMEQQVAEKQEQLARLQLESSLLHSRHLVLQSTMNNQEQMLAQLMSLKMEVAPPISGDGSGDAAAASPPGSGCDAPTAGPSAQQQQGAPWQPSGGASYWRKYHTYVQAAAAKLAQQAGVPMTTEQEQLLDSVPCEERTGFPLFPFTLMESLSLWNFSRHAADSAEQQRSGGDASDAQPPLSDFAINLRTRTSDYIQPQFWRDVARQIVLQPQQVQQLEAAWGLYARAMRQLNAEREQLTQRLQAMASMEGGAQPPASGSGSSRSEGGHPPAGRMAAVGGAPLRWPGGAPAAAAAPPRVLDVPAAYSELLDAVERNLMRGRATTMMFGWAMMCMLDAEQGAIMFTTSWPYFPLLRAIVGFLLGKEDLVP